jgi:hypothetical protein
VSINKTAKKICILSKQKRPGGQVDVDCEISPPLCTLVDDLTLDFPFILAGINIILLYSKKKVLLSLLK